MIDLHPSIPSNIMLKAWVLYFRAHIVASASSHKFLYNKACGCTSSSIWWFSLIPFVTTCNLAKIWFHCKLIINTKAPLPFFTNERERERERERESTDRDTSSPNLIILSIMTTKPGWYHCPSQCLHHCLNKMNSALPHWT